MNFLRNERFCPPELLLSSASTLHRIGLAARGK